MKSRSGCVGDKGQWSCLKTLFVIFFNFPNLENRLPADSELSQPSQWIMAQVVEIVVERVGFIWRYTRAHYYLLSDNSWSKKLNFPDLFVPHTSNMIHMNPYQ